MEHNFITLCGGKQKRVKKLKKVKKSKTEMNEKELAHGFDALRADHPQAYRSWTSAEEAQLQKMFERGKQMKEMSEKLGRKPGGIRSRLKKLGLVAI